MPDPTKSTKTKDSTLKHEENHKTEVPVEQDETSVISRGFGFMPKFQPKVKLPPNVKEEPMEVSPLRSVGGIWSDEEGVPNEKTQSLSSVGKSSKAVKQDTAGGGKNVKVENDVKLEDESEDDGELMVHGNVATAKKQIVFNIKLPAPQSELAPVGSKSKKKKSKKHKKNKTTKSEKVKTEAEKPQEVTSVSVTAATPVTAAPATTAQSQVSMANAIYMRQQMALYQQQQQQYYHPMYQHYMHSYHMQYSMHNPYMHYGNRPPLPSSGYDYNPPLPTQEPPPLPADG